MKKPTPPLREIFSRPLIGGGVHGDVLLLASDAKLSRGAVELATRVALANCGTSAELAEQIARENSTAS